MTSRHLVHGIVSLDPPKSVFPRRYRRRGHTAQPNPTQPNPTHEVPVARTPMVDAAKAAVDAPLAELEL